MESELSKKQYKSNSQGWRRGTQQAPRPMGFPRQEYRGSFPFPPPGDLPDPESQLVSPAWWVDPLPVSHQGRLSEGDEDESIYLPAQGFPGGSVVKNLPCRRCGLIPSLVRSPGEGNENHSSIFFHEFHTRRNLESTVHGVAKSQTGLSY